MFLSEAQNLINVLGNLNSIKTGQYAYQGIWDADANAYINVPAGTDGSIAESVGTQGHYYYVSKAGTTSINGLSDWKVGDWIWFDGGAWKLVRNNSFTTDSIEPGSTNSFFSEQQVRDTVLTDFSDSSDSAILNSDNILAAFGKTQGQINSLSGLAHSALTLGTSNGLSLTGQELTLGLANSSNNGALSSTDWSTFNNKQSALGFTPENVANKNQNGGYAGLNSSGKIFGSQLPALAITDTEVVNSEAAMLALIDFETGDIAVRTDLNKSFILKGTDPTDLADWQELLTPTDAVQSVQGKTGAITDLRLNDLAAASADYDFNNFNITNLAGITSTHATNSKTLNFTHSQGSDVYNLGIMMGNNPFLGINGIAIGFSDPSYPLFMGPNGLWVHGTDGTFYPRADIFINLGKLDKRINNSYTKNINVYNEIYADYLSGTSNVLISNTGKKIVESSVTATELTYSSGLSGNIQTQLNAKGNINSQTWTGTHIFPELTLNAMAPFIGNGTLDGNDNKLIALTAAGSLSGTGSRGALVIGYGNEFGFGVSGKIFIAAGNVADGIVEFKTANTTRGIFSYSGNFTLGTTSGTGTGNMFAGGYYIAATQVISSRKTGWTAATGTANRTTFDTATVTTSQLAERLKALIDDLINHGLIGT